MKRLDLLVKRTTLISLIVMAIVWLSLDVFELVKTPLTPANHWIPEAIAFVCLGFLTGAKKESCKPMFLWFLIYSVVSTLLISVIVGVPQVIVFTVFLLSLTLNLTLTFGVFGICYVFGAWRGKKWGKQQDKIIRQYVA